MLDGTARQFAIGDWIVMGFSAYEHGKWDAVKQIWGEDVDLLRRYEWIAKSIKSVRRFTDLSFSHHDAVASIPPDKQFRIQLSEI